MAVFKNLPNFPTLWYIRRLVSQQGTYAHQMFVIIKYSTVFTSWHTWCSWLSIRLSRAISVGSNAHKLHNGSKWMFPTGASRGSHSQN